MAFYVAYFIVKHFVPAACERWSINNCYLIKHFLFKRETVSKEMVKIIKVPSLPIKHIIMTADR